jgi:hypothetical protein
MRHRAYTPHQGRKASSVQKSKPVATLLSVFDGRICLGHLLNRGKTGVEVFSCDDVSVGVFADVPTAAAALSPKKGQAAS